MSGKFTVADDKDALGLKIKISNDNYKDSITAMASDFVLVDKDGNKVKGFSSYEDGDLDDSKLEKGDKSQGYVYFKAKKNTKYTLKYTSYDDEVKANTINIDTKKYKDGSKGPQAAVQAFVNTIYLNKDDKNYDKYVANDKDDEKNNFSDIMKDELKEQVFSGDTGDISDETNKKVADAVQKFNLDHGTIDTKIKKISDNEAEVEVKTNTINLESVGDKINDLEQKKFDDALDSDSDVGNTDKEANDEVANNISSYLKTTDMKKETDMTVKLTKDGNKWKVDTDDDMYEDFAKAFTGYVI
ncbi:DUF5105 domain-containing protein [Companilactobacillus sp. DQM5]|uniref:DUF5105 domain-containing protein n=1 Tax=Companilactobacillus sp. DQM5 TaxID=3463359 RepID=UPI00405A21F4